MATATINGITFEVSVSEMLALANSITAKIEIAPIDNSHVEKVVRKAVSDKRESNSTHTYSCGHTHPASRGRYSALCPNCKDSGASNSVKRTNKPQAGSEKAQTRKNGRRQWQYSADDSWREADASVKQIERLYRHLDTRIIPNKVRNSISAAIEAGMKAGVASDYHKSLKNYPLKGDQQR